MPRAPLVLLDVPSSRAQSRRQSNCADIRFARPNIQIYDAHVVDLYQWVCARYLVSVKVQKQRQAQLSSALDRISERITLAFQTLSRPEATRGSTIEIRKLTLYFNRIRWRGC